MAVVAVAADNNRIAEANITNDTGTWGNDGGGGGVSDEPDFYYQGGSGALTAQSRKVSTSRIGRSYTHGSGTDMTATDRRHFIAKIQITNKDALLTRTAPAAGIKIGSGSGAYYEYYAYGNDNYPKRGGWQILAISPNVSGYRNATTGSPSLTGVLYWSLLADFSATSKSENVIIDAIDLGAGLHLTGGDGADADGNYADFVSADEGTTANSWGYVFTEGNSIFVTGRLAIGRNTSDTAVATEFTDSDAKLEWTNGLVETGFNRHLIDLGSASTTVTLTRCSYDSAGEDNNTADRGYTTTEDSRPVFEVLGTSGTLTMTNCSISNFSSIDLTSACTLDTCSIINSGAVDAGSGADLAGSSILSSAVAADASALIWDVNLDPNGELDNMTFTKGANAHHAIELGTNSPTEVTLTGIDFSGFNASNGQNDSVIHVKRTTGDVTINVSGGSGTVSYKTDGANVQVVVNPVTTLITVRDNASGLVIQNARVKLEVTNGNNFPYLASVTITSSGTTATVTHTGHGLATNDWVTIKGANELRYNGCFQITVTGANTYTYTMTSTATSPATGTITATFAYFNDLTDVNGQVTDTRSISLDQAVIGKVRKGTTSPKYQQANIDETIDKDNGLTLNIRLVSDE